MSYCRRTREGATGNDYIFIYGLGTKPEGGGKQEGKT